MFIIKILILIFLFVIINYILKLGKKKYVALTFDDGPDNEKTLKVLEKLKNHEVVATFFMIGENINENTKGVIEEVITTGNEIGNHSYHNKPMTNMSQMEITDSISKTNDLVTKYSGQSPKFFRPPNLLINKTMIECINLIFVSGIISNDWYGQNSNAIDRANLILDKAEDGAIILMHDVQPDPHPTPEALDILIPQLKKRGYNFVTLSQLFEIKNINFKKNEKRFWTIVK